MSSTIMSKEEEETIISTKMPYPTKYIDVLGSKMAYVEAGKQNSDPIIFLHGNPTSKYLWRNIMPHLEEDGHLVAPDLIGIVLTFLYKCY